MCIRDSYSVARAVAASAAVPVLMSPIMLINRAGIVWVKFIGTHEQYDRINVESVNDY